MARQNQSPVSFNRSRRLDTTNIMTSGRAGKVVPVSFIPLLRGDSCSGSFVCDIELRDMPRPLLNGVQANLQAWFVPKAAFPQFSGYDEFMHSYQGKVIKTLGAPDRTPPSFFTTLTGTALTNFQNGEFAQTLGLHVNSNIPINVDLLDAYSLIYNFRLAAHSSKLARRQYTTESPSNVNKLARAFWPSGRFSRVVPDYERALLVGSMDLDVSAGRMPISGLGIVDTKSGALVDRDIRQSGRAPNVSTTQRGWVANPDGTGTGQAQLFVRRDPNNALFPDIWTEFAGQRITSSLGDIDKARETQAFAKLRASYAGNDATGFDNDDVIVAEMMQGLRVPEELFNRPWLLDAKRVAFGFSAVDATDGDSLGKSVNNGRLQASLSLNVPVQETGGVIIVTVEVLPERLDERQSDEWMNVDSVSKLPDALRDIQRVEPVDLVLNRRLDAKHTTPGGLYGYEPMNDKWNRQATRLGGVFFQPTPGAPVTEQRSAIWQADIVNPTFSNDHFLAPENFPHYVFSDTLAPAFEIAGRHTCTIVGLTQIGDVLSENNDDYNVVKNDL